MDLKFRRCKGSLSPKDMVLIFKTPIKFCEHKGRQYIIMGRLKEINRGEKKLLEFLFGDEIVYTKQLILVPRDFFFI